MTPTVFILRLFCALFCGVVIGVERQWRQRTAGLRTYTLVAVGSALFVLLGMLIPGDNSPTRIASQIVTGVGFLGAGVIMHSGLNVRGLNTAGTIWCSSAIGTLAGAGYYWQAIVGAATVLSINVLLRPLVTLINRQPVDTSEQEFRYAIQITCHGRQDLHLRALLVQLTSVSPLVLHELESVVGQGEANAVLQARLSSAERMDAQVEQMISRLSVEKDVVGLSWQLLPSSKMD